jgi:CHAT domain-containing protein
METSKSLSEIQSSLPDASQLILYSALADRLFIWVVSRSNTTFIEQPISDRELARLVDAHRAAIAGGRENREANDRLYSLLVKPVVATAGPQALLVLVPDGPLHQLAFATLRNPSNSKYLVEDYVLLVSPSASFFAMAQRASAQTGVESSALLIGNPAANGVSALPGAEREASAAAELYSSRELLLGSSATKERFLQSAPSAGVIHFGGHALVNPEFPLLSRLIFADEDHQQQSLYAHEIARLNLRHTRVVILAACSTAAGAVSRGEGVVSVARPFLASGVPTVIASQWDVDDSATEHLTLNFHRALATARDPIQALHAAQLAMLRSGNASWALPQSWGSFVAIGTAVQ